MNNFPPVWIKYGIKNKLKSPKYLRNSFTGVFNVNHFATVAVLSNCQEGFITMVTLNAFPSGPLRNVELGQLSSS